MTIRHQRRGEDHTFSINDVGRSMRIHVSEHGYRIKVSAEIKFDALTDRQAAAANAQLHAIITDAMKTAAEQRHINVALFELPDDELQAQGVNER